MKTLTSTFVLVGAAIAGVLMLSSHGAAQSPQNAHTWSYAYVSDLTGAPAVVYAESDGCRIEPVAMEPTSAFGNRDPDGRNRRGRALAIAIKQLGENGWEMVSAGFAYCQFRGVDTEDAIHFKRAR